jgi:hypothetical protein
VPYFANPQHFSHLRNFPKKLMLSAPRQRLMVPPLGNKKKPGLVRPGFLLYRDFTLGGYGASWHS